jgi:hypothetical protein
MEGIGNGRGRKGIGMGTDASSPHMACGSLG